MNNGTIYSRVHNDPGANTLVKHCLGIVILRVYMYHRTIFSCVVQCLLASQTKSRTTQFAINRHLQKTILMDYYILHYPNGSQLYTIHTIVLTLLYCYTHMIISITYVFSSERSLGALSSSRDVGLSLDSVFGGRGFVFGGCGRVHWAGFRGTCGLVVVVVGGVAC